MPQTLVPLADSQSGNRIELNEFVKDPLLIREVILNMMNQSFLADVVLRNAGTTPSGLVRYRESSPLYADTDPAVRAEGAEVPLGSVSMGLPMIAMVEEYAQAAWVTDEEVRRQNFDAFQRRLLGIRNSMRRKWDRVLFNLLFTHPRVQQMAAASPWDDPAAKQRIDIFDAKRLVNEAAPDDAPDSEFGFEADTMIIGRDTEAALFASDDFNRVYMNSPAVTESPIYRGQLDKKIYGLDVMVSPLSIMSGKVVIMQRNVAGFIANELPLTVSETYRWEPRKLARADVQRASAAGLDQPRAAVVINNVA